MAMLNNQMVSMGHHQAHFGNDSGCHFLCDASPIWWPLRVAMRYSVYSAQSIPRMYDLYWFKYMSTLYIIVYHIYMYTHNIIYIYHIISYYIYKHTFCMYINICRHLVARFVVLRVRVALPARSPGMNRKIGPSLGRWLIPLSSHYLNIF